MKRFILAASLLVGCQRTELGPLEVTEIQEDSCGVDLSVRDPVVHEYLSGGEVPGWALEVPALQTGVLRCEDEVEPGLYECEQLPAAPGEAWSWIGDESGESGEIAVRLDRVDGDGARCVFAFTVDYP